jgi:hypothetical protein
MLYNTSLVQHLPQLLDAKWIFPLTDGVNPVSRINGMSTRQHGKRFGEMEANGAPRVPTIVHQENSKKVARTSKNPVTTGLPGSFFLAGPTVQYSLSSSCLGKVRSW